VRRTSDLFNPRRDAEPGPRDVRGARGLSGCLPADRPLPVGSSSGLHPDYFMYSGIMTSAPAPANWAPARSCTSMRSLMQVGGAGRHGQQRIMVLRWGRDSTQAALVTGRDRHSPRHDVVGCWFVHCAWTRVGAASG